MTASRTLLVLLASTAVLGTSALAAPQGVIGVGAGGHGGIGVGAPPIGVPPAQLPPAQVPPVSVPKPQGTAVPPLNANAKAHAHANAQAALTAGAVTHGTLAGVSGTNATVELSNGTTQTYTVSAQTAARLAAYVGKPIAFRLQNGTLAFAAAGTPPLRGTLEAVNGTAARIKLANGATETYAVTAQQASWLAAHVGKTVAFWTSANGTIELNQSSHRSRTSRKKR